MTVSEAAGRRPAGDDAGFTLVEVLVAVAIIAVVMLGVGAVFVSTASGTDAAGLKQTAVRLATDGLDRAHAQASASLPTTPVRQTVDGVTYQQSFTVASCYLDAAQNCLATGGGSAVPMDKITITITWPSKACRTGTCSYAVSTLVAANQNDPLFNTNIKASAPVVASVANQVNDAGEKVGGLTVAVTGGNGALTFSPTGLPSGLAIDSSGVISGTLAAVTATAVSTVTITATDRFGLFGQTSFTWTVNPLPSLKAGTAATATAGTAVAVNLATSLGLAGGTAGYTWACPTVTSPLVVNAAAGTITGTPTAAGTLTPTCTVTDARGKTASAVLTLPVLAPLAITAPTNGSTVTASRYVTYGSGCGTACTWSATASGCSGTCTWSATGLPTGLTLLPTGALSGRPAAGTSYNVVFTVTDGAGRKATSTTTWKVT